MKRYALPRQVAGCLDAQAVLLAAAGSTGTRFGGSVSPRI